ncbi:MAG: hypothetical protein ACE5FH_08300, partial [Candidatus Zixiibacteriota bacterium]
MHRFILLLFTIGTALTATSIFAQEGQVRNIHFDTVRTGDVQATPVGVDEMKYIGTDYISADDSAYMRYITRIVQRDIDFYADFELVLVDSFYVKMYEIDEVSLLGWMRLGATYLVRLEAEFPGKNIRVRWRLFDCARGQRFARGKLDRNRTYWRELGHDIANEIVHTLTGEPGIFRSRIAYVRKIGKAKEIFVADYDGANEQQLTQTGSINISPMFAPNKDEVYFTSFMRGEPHLYKVDIFSKDITPVASYPGIVAAATLSPDGNKIACTLSKDGNSEIYVLNLKGKVIKRLTRHKAIDSSPTWSPDGRMMAFTSDRSGTPQIYMMDSDGL